MKLTDFDLPIETIKLLNSVKGKTVGVGLSGGVDSSVTALLLQLAGATVKAYTLQTFPNSKCCSLSDLADANAVATQLGIELQAINVRDIFQDNVVDYFINKSVIGETPNPCVPCNIMIKFGQLMNLVLKECDYYATGHYLIKEKVNDRWHLYKSIDQNKDQSYVLSMLNQKVFDKTIFPIGSLNKIKVKQIAGLAKLPVHNKSESQDLCFIETNKTDYLKCHLKGKLIHGDIIDTKGNILGKHNGLALYSVGQRKGLGVNKETAYYVKEINLKNNQLVIGKRDELYSNEFIIENVNWVSITNPETKIEGEIVIRNRMHPQKCEAIPISNNKLKIVMQEPVWALAHGQLASIRKGREILVSGWIV